MIIMIAAMLLAATTANIDNADKRRSTGAPEGRQEGQTVSIMLGSVPGTVPVGDPDSGTTAIDTSIPVGRSDRILALRDPRTGAITVYPDVPDGSSDFRRVPRTDLGRYMVAKPRNAAEAAVGICNARRPE